MVLVSLYILQVHIKMFQSETLNNEQHVQVPKVEVLCLIRLAFFRLGDSLRSRPKSSSNTAVFLVFANSYSAH